MDNIYKYYGVCGVKPAAMKPRPLIGQINQHAIDVLFTKKQVFMYIKSDGESVTIRENIIGGDKPRYAVVTVV